MATQRKMLGDILVENRLISEEQLAQALADQKMSKEKLGRILVGQSQSKLFFTN